MFRPPIVAIFREVFFEGILRITLQFTSTNNISVVLLTQSFVAKTIQVEIHE